jgi:hypothetical protein
MRLGWLDDDPRLADRALGWFTFRRSRRDGVDHSASSRASSIAPAVIELTKQSNSGQFMAAPGLLMSGAGGWYLTEET